MQRFSFAFVNATVVCGALLGQGLEVWSCSWGGQDFERCHDGPGRRLGSVSLFGEEVLRCNSGTKCSLSCAGWISEQQQQRKVSPRRQGLKAQAIKDS
ncbi:hypothetical protein K402DRAFT_390959 [Aulographum hederae CBS 113979]|uniref:Secreted protein n=1 Tax=Aulographum hederae CBS 113979 TaxID=1176131 RepID=A0A6G1H8I7_9PEZI|nr:hypothetical protein K402DRAFT_390959 [Aulographum hederae CBS 113979]